MIQDSQHGAKTYHNNGFSGAHLLVLGNFTAYYKHFRRLGVENGPLSLRDIEKIDRQDDGAAICIFSGDTLAWLVEHYPDLLGPIVYLFVFGELIDAYHTATSSTLSMCKWDCGLTFLWRYGKNSSTRLDTLRQNISCKKRLVASLILSFKASSSSS